MNLLRQQERLKAWQKEGMLETQHLHAALHAPVFEWRPAEAMHKLTADEAEFVSTQIQTSSSNVPTVAPFDCFRISMRRCFDQWFRYPDKQKWILFRCAYADAETGPEQWYVNIYGWNAGDRCEYRVWRDGKCVTQRCTQPDGTLKPEVSGLMHGFVETLSYFLVSIMLPGNTLLKVEPMRNGKSVEWRLARTHYLILNRRQAEQCQRNRNAPTDAQINRAAHWRRAHFRRLVSDRYKGRKNALIPIRQAWVGPKEWIGLDGKIYKVLELENRSTVHQNEKVSDER